jgi:deoxyribonucleoside regulator
MPASTRPDNSPQERLDTLADVAEWYYLQGLSQNEIARRLEVDRSTVSRMLSDARRLNIVEVHINRPLETDEALQERLSQAYGLATSLVAAGSEGQEKLLPRLGRLAARFIEASLAPGQVIGISWGTAVGAVVDEIKSDFPVQAKIVQLVGALGARNSVYDAHWLVQRLAQKLSCEAYYLNAPFQVDSPELVQALENTLSIRQVLELGKQCEMAILGIGSTEAAHSSFYQAGYVPLNVLQELQSQGLVGDVCGLHFTEAGETPEIEFNRRIVTIKPADLKAIPLRIGIAGGESKVRPILGALHAGYVNALVTDAATARKVISSPAARMSV